MLGAICGDIIGSAFETGQPANPDFALFSTASRFTDDTVMTVAVMDCLLNDKPYGPTFKEYGRRYPSAGYGGAFKKWLASDSLMPYNSYGNGSAMRVSPIGSAFSDIARVEEEATRSAVVTHNHPEGIKGAQSVAAAVFLAGRNQRKEDIRTYVSHRFDYNDQRYRFHLGRTLDEIGTEWGRFESCQDTVPVALTLFFESADYEDCIRRAVRLGGDTDTLASIAGGIAQVFYRFIPPPIIENARARLVPEFLSVIDDFAQRYGI